MNMMPLYVLFISTFRGLTIVLLSLTIEYECGQVVFSFEERQCKRPAMLLSSECPFFLFLTF